MTRYVMSDDSFADYILEQLSDLPGITTRKMFGSIGLYYNGTFFGIVADGVFYIKTNDQTREDYIRRGMKPFCPSPTQKLKNYYEVPTEVIEDRKLLEEWIIESTDRDDSYKA